MSKYVYSLVREFTNEDSTPVNYLCKDNYIHIRLRDFGNHKEVISGIEDKLTFYVVSLLNKLLPQYIEESLFDIANKEKYDEIFKSCLNKFRCSDEYNEIKLVLHCLYPNCLGVTILPKYSKKDTYDTVLSMFGNIGNDNLDLCSKITLWELLSDENTFIVVDTKKKVNCIKYIKKYAVKKDKSLWEI